MLFNQGFDNGSFSVRILFTALLTPVGSLRAPGRYIRRDFIQVRLIHGLF
jgi:hypothetical protein